MPPVCQFPFAGYVSVYDSWWWRGCRAAEDALSMRRLAENCLLDSPELGHFGVNREDSTAGMHWARQGLCCHFCFQRLPEPRTPI